MTWYGMTYKKENVRSLCVYTHTNTYLYMSMSVLVYDLHFISYCGSWAKKLNEQHCTRPISSFYRYRSWDSRSQSAGSSLVLFSYILDYKFVCTSMFGCTLMSAKPTNRKYRISVLKLTLKNPKLITNLYLKENLNNKNEKNYVKQDIFD